MARQPESTHDRFTFVPAAVAAKDGWLHMKDLSPMKSIWGGALSALSMSMAEIEVPADVISVNTVQWIADNFKEEDYLVVKMDVEGREKKNTAYPRTRQTTAKGFGQDERKTASPPL
eukprot:6472564-Amphidinium_carterae.1